MESYYTLIAEPGTITIASHFYRVGIGNNPKAHKALFVLSRYCRENNFYFQKRTRGDDIFRLKMAESLGVKVFELPCMVAKVEKLVSHLRNHGNLTWQPCDSGQLRLLKAQTEPEFFFFCNTSCLKQGT